jgi:hypothetical protein
MSGDVIAIGDLVTGSAMARAVEPEAGEGGAATSAVCLNCGAVLTSPFCGQCGQSSRTHRSLHTFGHDFFHSIFHFDGKIWRTLPMLFFKPGALTRRYVHGERAKFVSPLALFLFCVFAMFAVFSSVGWPITPDTDMGVSATREEIDAQIADARKELVALEAKQKSGGNAPGEIEGQIIGKKAEIAGLEKGRQFTGDLKAEMQKAQAELKSLESQAKTRADTGAAPDAALTKKIDDQKEFIKGLEIGGAFKDFDPDTLRKNANINTGSKAFDEKIRHALDNPELILYKVQANAYKFSWLLIPLSLPFVWLIFVWKRQVKIYDHLVFITYSLCFITLLLVIMSCLAKAGPLEALRAPLLIFAPPVHMFFQLRGAYVLKWTSALWRTFVLLNAAILVLSIFAVILIALGFM